MRKKGKKLNKIKEDSGAGFNFPYFFFFGSTISDYFIYFFNLNLFILIGG